MIDDQASFKEQLALSRCASIEFSTHAILLCLVLIPILVILFPILLLNVALVLFSGAVGSSGAQPLWLQLLVEYQTFFSMLIVIVVGAISIAIQKMRSVPENSVLRDVSGSDGTKLTDAAQEIWSSFGLQEKPPKMRWFPALDIAAYAAKNKAGAEIHVSAGLWRAIVSKEPIGNAILSHEMAHILHRDTTFIRNLNWIITATKSIFIFILVLWIITILAIIINQLNSSQLENMDIHSIVYYAFLFFLGSFSVLVLLPIGWLAFRRQAAFLISLIEIRADVTGAIWTRGLESFTQLFATHENVARSSRGDRISAIFSPILTHIPEKDRLKILSDKALLATPKIRFFLMSVVLVFLIPINFFTPMFLGGAGNYFSMLAISSAFNITLAAMLVSSSESGPVNLSIGRILQLCLTSIVLTSLPRINLEPISYFVMSWSAGFSEAPGELSVLNEYYWITVQDLVERFSTALINPYTIIAILISLVSLYCLAQTAGKVSIIPPGFRIVGPALAAGITTLIAGADSKRLGLPFGYSDLADSIVSRFEPQFALCLCLPIASAAIVDFWQTYPTWFRR